MSIANLTGRDGSGVYSLIDSVMGSRIRTLEAFDAMLAAAAGDPARVIAVHDGTTWDRYRTTTGPGGLHIATLGGPGPRA